jgi:hypothetical protein
MAVAFAAQVPTSGKPSRSGDAQSNDQLAVERRSVNKPVKEFPETSDLSTPESA